MSVTQELVKNAESQAYPRTARSECALKQNVPLIFVYLKIWKELSYHTPQIPWTRSTMPRWEFYCKAEKEARVEVRISLWLEGEEKKASVQWPPGEQYILGAIIFPEMDPDPRRGCGCSVILILLGSGWWTSRSIPVQAWRLWDEASACKHHCVVTFGV